VTLEPDPLGYLKGVPQEVVWLEQGHERLRQSLEVA